MWSAAPRAPCAAPTRLSGWIPGIKWIAPVSFIPSTEIAYWPERDRLTRSAGKLGSWASGIRAAANLVVWRCRKLSFS